jgi:hypothetical protein
MAEESKDAGTGQAPPASPPEGTPPGQAPAGPTDPKTQSELAEARREAAAARKALRELEAWKAAQEAAGLSEQERATRAARELETQLTATREAMRATRLELTIWRAAPDYQIAPAATAAALKLLDPALLEWDDATGVPTKDSIEKAMKALVRDYPFLVAADPAPARPAPNGPPTTPPADRRRPLTRADIERMPADEINARWGEVQAVLRQP